MELSSKFIRWVVAVQGAAVEREALRAARNPQKAQWKLLKRLLKKNARTEYGRLHGFDQVESVEGFRRRVPVNSYEDLRPWIEKQDQTNEPSLTAETPLRYAVTSGTTGKPKFIPVLESTLRDQRRIQRYFLSSILKDAPEMFDGAILSIVSPGTEGYLIESGRPYGSTSGHMTQEMSEAVKQRYVVPADLFGIEDYDAKYLAILLLALSRDKLTFVGTANPSTLVRLAQVLNDNYDRLVDMVERGRFDLMEKLNFRQQKALLGRLKARPDLALRLREVGRGQERIRLKDVFPDIKVVACWTGGSCRIFLEQLRGEFPEGTILRDLGYLSSEFRGTVVPSSASNAGLPTLWANFYEFVEKDAWEEGEQKFLGLHELEHGKQYYIFVTTDAGLLRYDMNDIVEVDGFLEKTPLLRFIQKGKGVTSITGEKLYESQLIHAVGDVEASLGLRSSFFMAEARPEESRYRLLYEAVPGLEEQAQAVAARMAAEIDERLGDLNIEYRVKRDSSRLAPIEVVLLRSGTFEAYKKNCLARGQREGQFKIVALQYAKDVKFDFGADVVSVRASLEVAV